MSNFAHLMRGGFGVAHHRKNVWLFLVYYRKNDARINQYG